MNEKEIRLELKRLVNIEFKQKEYKEIEYQNLKKLVSELINLDEVKQKQQQKNEGYIVAQTSNY
jgi:hypothetical protein